MQCGWGPGRCSAWRWRPSCRGAAAAVAGPAGVPCTPLPVPVGAERCTQAWAAAPGPAQCAEAKRRRPSAAGWTPPRRPAGGSGPTLALGPTDPHLLSRLHSPRVPRVLRAQPLTVEPSVPATSHTRREVRRISQLTQAYAFTIELGKRRPPSRPPPLPYSPSKAAAVLGRPAVARASGTTGRTLSVNTAPPKCIR